MKFLLFADNHFCETASIIRKFGNKYSMRLENQLQSINWVQEQAIKNNCDAIVCLGDFFNAPTLNEREITAVKEIQWSDTMPVYFIVGNHESSSGDLQYSSTKMLENPIHHIITAPQILDVGDCEICFLPYIIESDRKDLINYFGSQNKKRIIFSHNDIFGIQMGPVASSTGFHMDDISNNCDLFINGHLHNGKQISDKIINLGNLTGKDFGENAQQYLHNAMIVDTQTLTINYIENPYAFNFYKIDIDTQADFEKIKSLKNNAVASIRCTEDLVEELRKQLTAQKNIIEFRIIITKNFEKSSESSLDLTELTMDHLAKFVVCCHEKLDNTTALDDELAEICK